MIFEGAATPCHVCFVTHDVFPGMQPGKSKTSSPGAKPSSPQDEGPSKRRALFNNTLAEAKGGVSITNCSSALPEFGTGCGATSPENLKASLAKKARWLLFFAEGLEEHGSTKHPAPTTKKVDDVFRGHHVETHVLWVSQADTVFIAYNVH